MPLTTEEMLARLDNAGYIVLFEMQRVTQMKIGFVWACHADKRRHMRDWKSIQLVLACYNGAAVGKYRWPELRVTSCTAQVGRLMSNKTRMKASSALTTMNRLHACVRISHFM